MGSGQTLVQKPHQGSRVEQWVRRNLPWPLYSHPPTHTLKPQVQVVSQLGAWASLELSLRSWLRLASRSLSSVSSWVRSVCASMRRDSLCSTVDRQAGMGGYQTTCHPTAPDPLLPQPRQLLPPTVQKGLRVPAARPQFPLGSPTVRQYRSGRWPGWRGPGR